MHLPSAPATWIGQKKLSARSPFNFTTTSWLLPFLVPSCHAIRFSSHPPPVAKGKKVCTQNFPSPFPRRIQLNTILGINGTFPCFPPQKSFWPTHGTVSTTLPSLTPFFCPRGRSQVQEVKEFCCCCCCRRGRLWTFSPFLGMLLVIYLS